MHARLFPKILHGSSLPCNANQCRVQINACMLKMLHMCAYNIKTQKNGIWLGPVMDLFGILLDLSLENNAFPAALMDLFQKHSSRLIKLIVTARPNLSWHYGSLQLIDCNKNCPLHQTSHNIVS
ncbi:unnamed protein product [Sphagnum tenellum]